MKQNSGQFRTEHYFQCLQDLYWKLATGFVRQCECVAARGCCGINLTMVDCQILVGFWYCQKCLYWNGIQDVLFEPLCIIGGLISMAYIWIPVTVL